MKLRQVLGAYLATLVLFLLLDAAWLSLMVERFYRPALGHLLAPRVQAFPAVVFYLLYAAGITGFAVVPAPRPAAAAARGAALGMLAYATYDLSNQATLPGWPWHVTLADLAWGAAATGAAAGMASALVLAMARRR